MIWKESSRNNYKITVRESFQTVLGAGFPRTRIYGYANAAHPDQGPTWPARSFVLRRNTTAYVEWLNDLVDLTGRPLPHFLPIDTSIHWANPLKQMMNTGRYRGPIPVVPHVHGIQVEADSDGFPEAWFTPRHNITGKAYKKRVYKYKIDQEAGTPWYHDHALGLTRLNVYAGMAGFFVVRDHRDTGLPNNPLGLPAYPYEVGLVLQDRRFDTRGNLYYPSEPAAAGQPNPSITFDFVGDIICVNGKAWPVMSVERRKYRFRIINGADSRTFALKLDPPGGIHVIGVDGGFLNTRVQSAPGSEISIAPGERLDIIIDFTQYKMWQDVILRNVGMRPDFGTPNPDTDGLVMKFRVWIPLSTNNQGNGRLLTTYRQSPYTIPRPFVTVRNLGLFESTDDYGRGRFMLGTADTALGWDDPITENVREGTSEVWTISSTGFMPHPIHLHLVHFVVVGRSMDGGGTYSPPPLIEQGPKDTVVLNSGETVKIMARWPRGYTGIFVWHCHILAHEDWDMMRPYRVLPAA
eukprot:CAMPEP_0184655818 /NCGR_PEP_ID=MMETSP0308-20130426/14504_1 /TAXON_ID=38269 /ORGANISM="Gloeochaete witrockiana, Strain SAG 46.84" /LENGTH=521 /DNA_ID=CAMNT_0027092577 /DNA_START=372 /DNA_END=1937 /DNA_ORIENTATION=+